MENSESADRRSKTFRCTVRYEDRKPMALWRISERSTEGAREDNPTNLSGKRTERILHKFFVWKKLAFFGVNDNTLTLFISP